MSFVRSTAAAFALLYAIGARAEEPAEEVVVVASRTGSAASALPLALSVEDVDPLDPRGPGLSLAEEVVAVPGLLVRNRFNAAQGPRISIRGFGARSAFGIRGVTVLLDGIPLTLPDGLAQVDLVDPDLLGRIEVLRGPAGALYGNASGGVLSLHSATGDERSGEDVALRFGEYGIRKLVVRAAETVPAGSVVVAASAAGQEGFREHARAERVIVHGAGRLALSDRTQLGVVATVLDAPVAEDPGALTRRELDRDPTAAAPDNLGFDAGEEVTQHQVGARVWSRPTTSETVEVSVYEVGRSFVGRIPFRVNALDRDAVGGTASLTSQRAVFGREVRVTGAVEAGRLEDRRSGWDSDGGVRSGPATLHQEERVLALAGYGQARVELVDGFGLLGGARYDRAIYSLEDLLLDDGDTSDDRTFDNVDGLVGAILNRGPVAAYTSLSDAHENPTITELSLRPDGEAGFVDDLDPQRARTAEAGARLQTGVVSADASVFTTWLRNELVPFSDETGRTFYRNAGRSHRHGLELAGAAALPQELTVAVAWTWIDARFDDYTVAGVDLAGRAVPGVPPHHVGLSAGWGTGDGLFSGLDIDTLSATSADDTNRNRSPTQAVASARAGYRGVAGRLRFELRLGVENLIDSTYVDNLRVNASNGRYYEPGSPRLFHGGLTVGRSANPPTGGPEDG